MILMLFTMTALEEKIIAKSVNIKKLGIQFEEQFGSTQ